VLLITDQSASVLRLIRVANAMPVTYGPFGFRPPVVLEVKPAFNGELQDRQTQGYLLGNGYRIYNPVLARFSAPDNLSPFGEGGINAYAYCAADPINAIDPSGHFRFSFTGALKRLGILKKTANRAGTQLVPQTGSEVLVSGITASPFKGQSSYTENLAIASGVVTARKTPSLNSINEATQEALKKVRLANRNRVQNLLRTDIPKPAPSRAPTPLTTPQPPPRSYIDTSLPPGLSARSRYKNTATSSRQPNYPDGVTYGSQQNGRIRSAANNPPGLG
jgi:RHS repeat-associated protein